MSKISRNLTSSHAKSIVKNIGLGLTLPFAEVLPQEWIEEACKDVDHRERVFTPMMTVYAFLSQVMSDDQSCQNTISQILAHRAQQGSEQALSANTSAYCQARDRLPEAVLSGLTQRVALALEEKADPDWKWQGHCVKLIDGTTVSMPDTEANQAVYPQSCTQKKGWGFHWPEWLERFH